MKLRPPSVPLITVDPYFSVWSPADSLTGAVTEHWTGKPNTLTAHVTIDGEKYRFLGVDELPAIKQTACEVTALLTQYEFTCSSIILAVDFYTPLLPDRLDIMARPVSYMRVSYVSADGKDHDVSLDIAASEEFCINLRGETPVRVSSLPLGVSLHGKKMGSVKQPLLSRRGDDLRIDWGYFALVGSKKSEVTGEKRDGMTWLSLSVALEEDAAETLLFAYDDIKCLDYFGTQLDAYWKKDGQSFADMIKTAWKERESLYDLCHDFSLELYADAYEAGGEAYADLLSLAFRQVIAAHKLAVDPDGEALFISKECFSNGCAATVDVTYPSSPMLLYYNTELLKGTLRPIFRYAASEAWPYDFAPHDVGTYPWLIGQRYGENTETGGFYDESQMPVEESGNMLIMAANISMADGSLDFVRPHFPLLEKWVRYLEAYGEDPENQLCTDDFAGHLAHNCNLSLKAIMGLAGYAIMLRMDGREAEAEAFMNKARRMADSWVKRAANPDGSFRLAFDQPGSFSMKYNIVWDKLWNTGLFAPSVLYAEFASNRKHFGPYGMPLDNRQTYTKSDWIAWTATLAPTKEEFMDYIAPMVKAYSLSLSRAPLGDWYDTVTAEAIHFRHRSVQGGLFIKLLDGLGK